MKNIFFFIVIVFLAIISCRNSDEDLQVIDQRVHLYIDSAGIDMLNANDDLAYRNLTFNDVYGQTESSPVSLVSNVDENSVYYRIYIAGAVRRLVDSTNPSSLIYESKIALRLTRQINNVDVNTYDTLTLRYKNEPQLFQVDKAFYNNQEITMNKIDEAYRLIIHK